MDIAAIITWITENTGTVLSAITSIIGGFAVIAALTPTPKDDAVLAKIRKVIDFLGANVGNAKNAPKP